MGVVKSHPHPLLFIKMSKASKLISKAITGEDYELVFINGKSYVMFPPTIKKLAGAISCISDLDFNDGATLKDVFLSCKDCTSYSKALSWLIRGDASLESELSEATLTEILDAMEIGLDMVGVTPFYKAASLTRSANLLAASPR